MNIVAIGAVALLSAAAAPSLALAQGYGAPPPPPAPGGGMDHRDHGPGDMRRRMEAHEQERLQALHAVLRIRPEQESAFQAFVAAMRPAKDGEGWKRQDRPEAGADMAQLTTPQRLDRMAQIMDEHEARRHAAFERRAGATKALYAALSPEQRQVMDALPELQGHGGHGWGEDGEMGHGPGGMRPMGPPPPAGA